MNSSYYELVETKLSEARAMDVSVTEDALTVDLDDARTISVPLVWYPRLWHATPEERSNWEIIGAGDGIHWPDLDEDISMKSLLIGFTSGESSKSFKRWLERREVQRKSSRSDVRILLEGIDMRFENIEEVVRRLMRIENRLKDYDYLCQNLMTTDVTAGTEFQIKYRDYYVMNDLDWEACWYDEYFRILEREKFEREVPFERILKDIHAITNRVETSFTSKLLATVNPCLAVYDKYVRENLRLENPSDYPREVRIDKSIEVYSCLQILASEIIQSESFDTWRNRFDEAFPQFSHFTDIKKLDLFLWQNR